MNNPDYSNTFDRISFWISNSIMVKIATIAFLILLMMIPLVLIQELVLERSGRQQEVKNSITQDWSKSQLINGPILSVPVSHYEIKYDSDGKEQKTIRESYHHFLPESLNYSGSIDHKKLNRGIYEVAVYESDLIIDGLFKKPEIKMQNLQSIRWEDAFLTFGISDMKGIKEAIVVNFGDTDLNIEPGSRIAPIINTGFNCPLSGITQIDVGQSMPFHYDLKLKGSQALKFTPLGKTTSVNLSSTWPDPSFQGQFSPEQRNISKEGFEASWKVLHLNRNFPQHWIGDTYSNQLVESAFGVELFVAANDYQAVTRASKYGIMTIALTFLVFFLVELIGKIKIHPMQYILVGLAVCLFYVLLISISEHSEFHTAYFIATTGVIGIIFLYTLVIFKNWKHTLILLAFLLGIYAFVFVTLQLVDYALLIGSLGLTIILALTMYLTRNINWFNLNPNESLKHQL